jgi:hypothetical protein
MKTNREMDKFDEAMATILSADPKAVRKVMEAEKQVRRKAKG